jgi:threonine synthase
MSDKLERNDNMANTRQADASHERPADRLTDEPADEAIEPAVNQPVADIADQAAAARTVINYIDTRGDVTKPLPFSSVITAGPAPGGGLYVPQSLPSLSLEEILGLADLSYASQAAFIFKRFGVDFADGLVDDLMGRSYGDNFTSPDIAPIAAVGEQTYMLELTHGPTAAFKDMALQCLPHFYGAALEQSVQPGQDIPLNLILVATSGDTGSAAQQGFKGREHSGVIVFYPRDGVSDIQRRQMTTVDSPNIGAFGIEGNFDDCQAAVKAILIDHEFAEALRRQGVRLSSANSINWGRLLPQVVYFATAYARLVSTGRLEAGQTLEVSVPTGNFGHILAAWYARQMGVPINRLYCASNDNHVLTDFINSGTYNIAGRPFKQTPSPSMDILVSSNLERLLFELCGRDSSLVSRWMADLAGQHSFNVDDSTLTALREGFCADWVTSSDSLKTIRRVHERHGYLLDPHTAVAWQVAQRLRPSADTPVLVVATAHWAKFAAEVYRALAGLAPGQTLPPEVAGLNGFELISAMQEQFDAGAVPERLASLDGSPEHLTATCSSETAALKQAILGWLEEKNGPAAGR